MTPYQISFSGVWNYFIEPETSVDRLLPGIPSEPDENNGPRLLGKSWQKQAHTRLTFPTLHEESIFCRQNYIYFVATTRCRWNSAGLNRDEPPTIDHSEDFSSQGELLQIRNKFSQAKFFS
jgi:hypothetical protein